MQCPICKIDPESHSFKKVSEKNGISTYYTNPTKAKDRNTDGILTHYENTLEEIGNKKWIWIFDSDGFDMKHALEVKTGIGITKLIKDKDNLLEIKIINPTWHIHTMLLAVVPFLNKTTKNKIKILKDRYYSVIEFL